MSLHGGNTIRELFLDVVNDWRLNAREIARVMKIGIPNLQKLTESLIVQHRSKHQCRLRTSNPLQGQLPFLSSLFSPHAFAWQIRRTSFIDLISTVTIL
jgi:hypothetical protein